ncbi:MAG: hypothetical protein N3E46_06840, partial [Gemmataceae bacterium]|nr:hypothetical protein [Gemmataceae bacterium]
MIGSTGAGLFITAPVTLFRGVGLSIRTPVDLLRRPGLSIPSRSSNHLSFHNLPRPLSSALSLASRDIGEPPAVVDLERKARAASDFRFFCEQYFPLTFSLPWSPDHLKVIAKIEQAVLRGGLFAMAMPRGSGKSTICECACIWAVLYGHREFVCLIGSDEGHAMDMLDSIKMELDGNDLLLEDFPEVVYP